MNYIDIKITVWNRLKFSDGSDMHELSKLIMQQGVESVIDDNLGFNELEILFDTEQRIEPEENKMAPTIEVYQHGKLLWQNGIAH